MAGELIKTIFARRSIRKYTAKPISREDIKTILQAAMAAPSSSNRKPWHFIVVTDRQQLDKLAKVRPMAKCCSKPLFASQCVATQPSHRAFGCKIALLPQRTFYWRQLRWGWVQSGLVFTRGKVELGL